VRQRLRAHADTIADPSIKSLYAADFSARFDALYLARPDQPRRVYVAGKKYQPPLAGASAALRARAGGTGSGEVAALLMGLLVHPRLADHHGEALAALPIGDSRQSGLRDAMLAALATSPDLESAALKHNLESKGVGEAMQAAIAGNRLRFSFTRDETSLATASRDFGMMVETIAARVRIEAELATATARLRSSLDETDFRQQQLLLAERVEIDAAMMRLAESLRDD
jgi:DNA primase